MAEAIVGPLVSKLQELALSEGKALVAVSGDIGRLRDKLMWLLAFLQEAEPGLRAHGGQLMRVLVHQIRDAAFSAEDAIDEYSVRVDLSRYPGWSRPLLGFLAGVTTQLRFRHNLSGNIAAINARLEGIVRNKSTFSLEDTASSLSVKMWAASAASSSEPLWNIWMRRMIGRKEQQSKLEEMLLRSSIAPLTVIYVVGMSGVGRTKLVDTVCWKPTIRNHFEVSAVVKVRNNTSVHNIVRMICDELKEKNTKTYQGQQGQDPVEQQVEKNTQTNQGQEQAGASELERRLHGKRYLVVIDGRKMAFRDWNAVIHALPKGGTGSRVLMITKKVPQFRLPLDYQVEEMELEGLLYDDCKKMFKMRLGDRVPADEVAGRTKFYERAHCVTDGSPLAVILLSGLIHDKEYPHEWDSVLEHLLPKRSAEPMFCLPPTLKSANSKLLGRVLALSFEDLHHELKLCFLYFAAFPESYKVHRDTLVKLWVAEGFLSPRNGKTAELLGDTYVRQLIARGLVHSAGPAGRHLALHERVYYFARSEAQEASFMEMHDGGHVPTPATVRRLTLQNTMDRYVALHCMPKLRSIIAIFPEENTDTAGHRTLGKPVSTALEQSSRCQLHLSPSSGPAASRGLSGAPAAVAGASGPVDQRIVSNACRVVVDQPKISFFDCFCRPLNNSKFDLTRLLQGSKFLRVIMLEGLGIGKELPEAIGSMVHLRYLGVRCQSLKTIHPSIKNLNNLQTMDVANSSVEKLPESFWKIKSLRHVTGHQLRMPRRVGELKQLLTLSSARMDFQNLTRMVNLRTLDMIIEGVLTEKAKEFSDCLNKMNSLTDLKLDGSGLPMSIFTSPSLRRLQRMCLVGTVQQLETTSSLPRFQLPNLFSLSFSLKGTQLQKDFIESLGELPLLGTLIFDKVLFEGTELVFQPEGFRPLKTLRIDNTPARVSIEEHALPMLRSVEFSGSSRCIKHKIHGSHRYTKKIRTEDRDLWEIDPVKPSTDTTQEDKMTGRRMGQRKRKPSTPFTSAECAT